VAVDQGVVAQGLALGHGDEPHNHRLHRFHGFCVSSV
jgi:hypothetical protein